MSEQHSAQEQIHAFVPETAISSTDVDDGAHGGSALQRSSSTVSLGRRTRVAKRMSEADDDLAAAVSASTHRAASSAEATTADPYAIGVTVSSGMYRSGGGGGSGKYANVNVASSQPAQAEPVAMVDMHAIHVSVAPRFSSVRGGAHVATHNFDDIQALPVNNIDNANYTVASTTAARARSSSITSLLRTRDFADSVEEYDPNAENVDAVAQRTRDFEDSVQDYDPNAAEVVVQQPSALVERRATLPPSLLEDDARTTRQAAISAAQKNVQTTPEAVVAPLPTQELATENSPSDSRKFFSLGKKTAASPRMYTGGRWSSESEESERVASNSLLHVSQGML